MSIENRHIIRKQVIELELPTQEGALGLQQKIGRLYRYDAINRLERVFDNLDLKGQTLRIPRLEINLGQIAPGQLEREFVDKCVQAIQRELQKRARQLGSDLENGSLVGAQEIGQDAFFHFLENGILPWYADYEGLADFEERILEALPLNSDQFKVSVISILRRNRLSITRLALQFSEHFLNTLLELVWHFKPQQWQAILSEIELVTQTRISAFEKRQLYKAVFIQLIGKGSIEPAEFSNIREQVEAKLRISINDQLRKKIAQLAHQQFIEEANLSVDRLIELLKRRISVRPPLDALPNQPKADFEKSDPLTTSPTIGEEGQQSEAESLQEDGWYVENAGLVICVYFLKPFFEGLGLLQDGHFKDKAAQYKAVHLSQFLVTGKGNPAEFVLLLNKVVCGVPSNEPVPRLLELTPEEREEAENLLQYVIKYWTILGNTSIEALRNTFLKRRGKLSYERSRSSWLMQVEEKGYDICVEQLPWSISLVKLPWMKEPINVEWV